MKYPQITWNTGRQYTEAGQRIAAVAIDGGVLMADYDRCLQYFFPECELIPSAIMARYDSNNRGEYRPPKLPVEEFNTLRDALHQAAKAQIKTRTNTFDL